MIDQHAQLAMKHYKYVKGILELNDNNNSNLGIDSEETEEMLLEFAKSQLLVALRTLEKSCLREMKSCKDEIKNALTKYEGYYAFNDNSAIDLIDMIRENDDGEDIIFDNNETKNMHKVVGMLSDLRKPDFSKLLRI